MERTENSGSTEVLPSPDQPQAVSWHFITKIALGTLALVGACFILHNSVKQALVPLAVGVGLGVVAFPINKLVQKGLGKSKTDSLLGLVEQQVGQEPKRQVVVVALAITGLVGTLLLYRVNPALTAAIALPLGSLLITEWTLHTAIPKSVEKTDQLISDTVLAVRLIDAEWPKVTALVLGGGVLYGAVGYWLRFMPSQATWLLPVSAVGGLAVFYGIHCKRHGALVTEDQPGIGQELEQRFGPRKLWYPTAAVLLAGFVAGLIYRPRLVGYLYPLTAGLLVGGLIGDRKPSVPGYGITLFQTHAVPQLNSGWQSLRQRFSGETSIPPPSEEA